MKKLLLAGTAIAGVAVLASPAQADLKLDLAGHARVYAVYSDSDETRARTSTGTTGDTATNTGASLRNFDFRRDMEVHFTGETTTDSGLTVGVHSELKLGNESGSTGNVLNFINNKSVFAPLADPNQTDEAYVYFSGGWGRVNFGSEDGAAYLLQVAAPSADSNVDGLRVYVQSWNQDAWDNGFVDGSNPLTFQLGYDNALFRDTDRFTYMTPKWNGFQAGVSYAPQVGQVAIDGSIQGTQTDNDFVDFENLWEIAARWDGEFEGFGISAGVGYNTASNEVAQPANTLGSDDMTAWDAGLNVSWNDFSLGGAYRHLSTGVSDSAGNNSDITTWVVGAAWDNGPYHLGLSYFDQNVDNNAFGFGLADDMDMNRWTVGGGYTYGPGMTFRGSFSMLDVDNGSGNNGFLSGPTPVATPDPTQYQIAIGTDINF